MPKHERPKDSKAEGVQIPELQDTEIHSELTQTEINAEARKLIKELGFSQTELARITGKSQSLISLIETGQGNATPSFFNHLKLLAGRTEGTGTHFERRLTELLALFPEESRQQASELTLAFVEKLLRDFGIKK